MPVARRGEIWLIDLSYAAKVRPTVVLRIAFEDHERAIVTYVPRTTAPRGTRFEVPHQGPGFDPGVFDAQRIAGVPAAKLVRKPGVVNAQTMHAVEKTMSRWLGLPAP